MSSFSSGGSGDGSGLNSRPVHAYFRRLNLNANERWIEASIAQVRRGNPAVGMSALIKSCFEMWIGTDISTDDVQVRIRIHRRVQSNQFNALLIRRRRRKWYPWLRRSRPRRN